MKELKRSIRDKYRRRERDLYYSLEQYLIHAEDRLDESRAGNIRDRDRVEDLVSKCKELMEKLPLPKEFKIDPNMSVEGFLGENNTEQILKEMKEWSDNLTDKVVERIRGYSDRKSSSR